MVRSGPGSGLRGSRSNLSQSRQSHSSSLAFSPASNRKRSQAPTSHWQNGSGSGSGSGYGPEHVPRRLTIRSRQSFGHPSSVSHSSQAPRPSPVPLPLVRSADQNDDDRENPDHVIMALDVRDKGTVGCAYYLSSEERLLCMEDIPRGGIDTVERLKVDLQPTMVLISSRADALSDFISGAGLRRASSLVDAGRLNGSSIKQDLSVPDSEVPPLPYDTELRPGPDFNVDAALSKLTNLGSLFAQQEFKFFVPGDNMTYEQNLQADEVGLSDRQGKLLQISSWLDLSCKVSIGCAGAVINYLQRRRASEYLPDDVDAQLAFRILHMEMFTLKETMLVNADTLSSLQIIQPESHPNAFKQGSGTTGSKESLSIFGLFQKHARTPQGKARLRSLFLHPSCNIEEINSRLDFITMFVRPDNQDVAQRLSKSLTRIKNMKNVTTLLQKGVDSGTGKYGSFKGGTWSSLLEFCYHTIDIVDAIQEVLAGAHLPLCARIIETINKFHLQRIGRMIHEIVDLDLSNDQSRTVVRRGVDPHLDQFKNAYDGMDDFLSLTATEIARAMPPHIECQLNVVFFPQLGFHITVPMDEKTGQGVWSDTGWERMFNTPNQVYFKNVQVRKMDRDFGDLWSQICDVEIDIAHDLAQRVLQDEVMLVTVSELCGELDSLLAFVHCAIEYKLVRPKLVNENVIDIKGGRHILQEMTVPLYVPNDTALAGGDTKGDEAGCQQPCLLMLTGPNYSGKSVYQKQVALILYLAQIGSFVPAEACVLGITDKILTRITTKETVSKGHSAFMIDLQQIAMALNSCTCRSLILIDEFGKGTDTCDGAGLASGVFYHLLELGSSCPKVIATTHFHEMFELGLFEENDRLKHAHMEVRVDQVRGVEGQETMNDSSNSEVIYLYNLRGGRSSLSYGAQCAAQNGVPGAIVKRAIELANMMVRGEDLVTFCSAMKPEEAGELAEAEAASRAFLQQNFEVKGEHDGEVSAALSDILAADIAGEESRLGEPSSQETEGETGSRMVS